MSNKTGSSIYTLSIIAAAIAIFITFVLWWLWPATPVLIHPVPKWISIFFMACGCGLAITFAAIKECGDIKMLFFIGACGAMFLSGIIVFICVCVAIITLYMIKKHAIILVKDLREAEEWLPIIQTYLKKVQYIILFEKSDNPIGNQSKFEQLKRFYYIHLFKLLFWIKYCVEYNPDYFNPSKKKNNQDPEQRESFITDINGVDTELAFIILLDDNLSLFHSHPEVNLQASNTGEMSFGRFKLPYIAIGKADKRCPNNFEQ